MRKRRAREATESHRRLGSIREMPRGDDPVDVRMGKQFETEARFRDLDSEGN